MILVVFGRPDVVDQVLDRSEAERALCIAADMIRFRESFGSVVCGQ